MSKREEVIELCREGYAYREIAETLGITRQRVYQILKDVHVEDFTRLKDTDCVYPNIKKWWNENRMTYMKFFKAMDLEYHAANINRFKTYIKGKSNPRKKYIDKLITTTGMTYEQLFYREGD